MSLICFGGFQANSSYRTWLDIYIFNVFMCPFKQRDMSVMTGVPNFYALISIFSTLCVVHDLIFQRKLSRRRLLITSVCFVSHASAQALRLITFTQRSRTTRHPFSIQLLSKPKIRNVEDKKTNFERSKGDLGQCSELCKCLWHDRRWVSTWICVVFKILVDGSYRYTRGFEAIGDFVGLKTMHWYAFLARLTPVFWEFSSTKW